ncbi:hypothetical protein TBLA_0E00210 [Henningerozyma blattae CBS 6284]|uniref:DUF155 domain-containing protein n=1 Tax=Henningerozyma blattae (strain ATCC 34711 / CBS 6284 / DSM 70876 / NBRC 10599 / NRRL Y-10934 / UCD 77-7) TaxID=1071380 RepID=I2H3Y1_HENB6|nr:hypothetical protein TBLA_0E00210 [Tetrapisispora blattae CBS 6284]CCH61083.1 hypothetical protein TBLA_0E00210 [Tetrapisispora blattae CBS 6284]
MDYLKPSKKTEKIEQKKPLSKRSPSILVTDYRSNRTRKSAPFAGHAADSNSNLEQVRKNLSSYSGGYKSTWNRNLSNNSSAANGNVFGNKPFKKSFASVNNGRKSRRGSQGRFSDISIDNILQDTSEIPSARREERSSGSSYERFSMFDDHLRSSYYNFSKTITPLPPRTSKTSQKLVLIPEEPDSRSNSLGRPRSTSSLRAYPRGDRSRYGIKAKARLPRLTAYHLSEGLNLKLMSKFLKKYHEVSPRLYDECLYVAYTLPLLPGKDGYRIKSNISKKVIGGKTLIDKMIDASEQRDHHYEYYSGVEVLEDANNNYELSTNPVQADTDINNIPDHLPNTMANTDNFNPSEPQYFAEETPSEQKLREQEEQLGLIANSTITTSSSSELITGKSQHAEIFIFRYGVIVFWNFTEAQEKNILGDIAFADYKDLVIRPLDEQDIETEEFHFEYDADTERPRIFNDVITLRSGDHIIKLTLSHSIAQSSKLSRFESRLEPLLNSVTKLPKRLALYGTLGLTRQQLLKKSGKLFKLRVDVNLSSSVLDTPEFFWTFEPSLHPLYVAMREYLEIDERVQVVNDRCMVLLEFFNICVDSVAERNIARVTWWFIIVLILGVLFSLTEILIRYLIIQRHQ